MAKPSRNSQPPASLAVSLLLESSSDSTQRLPISGGTRPVKLLLARLMAFRLDAMASDAGIGPLRLFPPVRWLLLRKATARAVVTTGC